MRKLKHNDTSRLYERYRQLFIECERIGRELAERHLQRRKEEKRQTLKILKDAEGNLYIFDESDNFLFRNWCTESISREEQAVNDVFAPWFK